ncbi:MAG: M23 family metallopeptidase [Candidatus Margulisiibacteriota bacterium]
MSFFCLFVFCSCLLAFPGSIWPADIAPQLSLSTSTVSTGQTLVAYLDCGENISNVSGEFLSQPIYWYPVESKKNESNAASSLYRAYLPIPLAISPGYYQLKANYLDTNGNSQEMIERVQIIAGKFTKVNFSVPVSKKKLMRPAVIANDWVIIETELTGETESQLCQGKFIYPLAGNYYLTLPFGVRETVNRMKRGQHMGMDFSHPKKNKTDILAINDGVVRLAQTFVVFGGTVVIDHGQGIFSLYYHLSKINVEPGQVVAKGQVLGKMGTTGISSGIHLHLGISVHNQRVNPAQWLKNYL